MKEPYKPQQDIYAYLHEHEQVVRNVPHTLELICVHILNVFSYPDTTQLLHWDSGIWIILDSGCRFGIITSFSKFEITRIHSHLRLNNNTDWGRQSVVTVTGHKSVIPFSTLLFRWFQRRLDSCTSFQLCFYLKIESLIGDCGLLSD